MGVATRFCPVTICFYWPNIYWRTTLIIKNEKQGILHIRAKDSISNQWVNLEVQVVYSEIYPQRSKYYLAGLYRDQLEKNKYANYDDLTPVYGIHVLVETLFRDKDEQTFWFHHYAMLNTRSHAPLIGHWHLYYVELDKFLDCFNNS
ncbi:MAG: PD-(D/E)XK nuclease family transposase [Desulfamplus sp.]|nr:PD-(D/E)XK nuclease family transposase [Desulfamplus sp.]